MPVRRPVILYHANCADGFTAAWTAWLQFGNLAKYVPCHYGQPVYELEEDDGDIYLLDFSYKADDMDKLYRQVVDRHRELLVLDHHESAFKELVSWTAGLDKIKDFPNPSKYTKTETTFLCDSVRNLYIMFDLNECGASLAWRHWWSNRCPPIVNYVKDRDLWTKKLPYTEEVSAYIATLEQDFGEWSTLRHALKDDVDFNDIVARGGGALALKSSTVKKAVDHAIPITLKGEFGYAVNASAFFSEIAGELACLKEAKFGAVYFQRGDLRWQFSLRSRSDFKVNDLAAQFGGGGHPQAAGFEVDNLEDVRIGWNRPRKID